MSGEPWSPDPDLNPVVQSIDAHEALRALSERVKLLEDKFATLMEIIKRMQEISRRVHDGELTVIRGTELFGACVHLAEQISEGRFKTKEELGQVVQVIDSMLEK